MNYDFETGIINVSECLKIVQTLHYIMLQRFYHLAVWADHFWLSSNLIVKLPWN